ncbi:MAG: 6-phosphofructokinase [Verrucomicrobia bacterium]|nr:6-phosphofructokinase [Verrucomicrobiota bacterium]MBV8481935.1 6-phosphofructokinase [Verrucomicrobiota bacterium]
MTLDSWRKQYVSLVPRLAGLAQRTRLSLCGLATCTDAYLRLADAGPLFAASGGKAAWLAKALQWRAANGIGGELFFDWPEAEGWIAQNLDISSWGLGGTGAQAAQTLAVLGARALVTLQDRSQRQLSVIHPDVLVATRQGLEKRGALEGSGPSKPAHYIFEFSAGELVGPERAKRSTRVIVRFADDPLDRDLAFVQESVAQASQAGAAVICGFNEVASASLATELEYSKNLLSAWRDKGLTTIHLELGGYEDLSLRDQVLSALAPLISSLGMSHSELRQFGSGDVDIEAINLHRKLGLNRICVHADTWGLSVTNNDPEHELESLMCGCLVASCRAARGHISVPTGVPPNTLLYDPPYPPISKQNGSTLVCCPAPYLEQPKATIGLGDTFLAGTLLTSWKPEPTTL